MGGGAGGSVNITAATLAGSGTIRANGGNGYYAHGGGGRISLNGVTTDNFTGTLQVNGGSSGGKTGTIYLNSTKRTNLVLGGSGNLASLKLGSDDTNNYIFTNLTVNSGGSLEVDSNPNMNSGAGGYATLTVSTSIDVNSGSTLTFSTAGATAGVHGEIMKAVGAG